MSNNLDAERRREKETEKTARFFGFSDAVFPTLLIVLHVSIALYLAYYTSIWKDEASTLYTTGNGFWDTLQNVSANEKQAPLYFLLVSLWRSLDDSIFFARVFSIIWSAAAIKFFYDLAQKFVDQPAARFLAVFFAVHPILFWASAEIRVYSLLILFSILLLKFFVESYLENKNDFSVEVENSPTRARIYFGLTAIVALYTNYYLGFLLVGAFLALVAVRRFRAARDYFLQMLVVGAVFLPLLWSFKQQLAVRAVGFASEKSIGEAAGILAYRMWNLIFPLELSFGAGLSVFSISRIGFLAIVAAAIFYFLTKSKFRAANEKTWALAVISLTICAFLLTAYFALGAEYIVTRHFSVLFVPFFLLAGALAANVLPKRSRVYVAVLFVLLFPYTKIYKQFSDFGKQGDWARVARFIEQNEKPNQPIVIFPNFDALALPFHYAGANPVVPQTNFFAWNYEDSPGKAGAMKSEIRFVISQIPPEAAEIWLATAEICQNPHTSESCRPLENFVEAHYTVVDTRDFYEERLRLLRKK